MIKGTTFVTLDKSKKVEFLPELFRIFYENTAKISPFTRSYESEMKSWVGEVSPALEKAPRQIILIYHGNDLAGFVMYYVRGDLLMIEELQLKEKYQRTLLLYKTVKHMIELLSSTVGRIEAYALRKNSISIGLMRDMGFLEVGDTGGTKFMHFSLDLNSIMSRINRKNY